jgi:hypothetical protein
MRKPKKLYRYCNDLLDVHEVGPQCRLAPPSAPGHKFTCVHGNLSFYGYATAKEARIEAIELAEWQVAYLRRRIKQLKAIAKRVHKRHTK